MLLVDTNVILAAADASAVEYDTCARLLDGRAGELERYQELGLGLVDASVVAVAERR